MDGLERAAGVGPTIKLGGQTLQVRCRILEHHAMISAEIAKSRGNPFEMVRQAREALNNDEGLIANIVTRILYDAREWQYVTIVDIGRWIAETWAGQCFAVWLSVRDNDPKVWTLEKVTQDLSREYEEITRRDGSEKAEEWLATINRAIDSANGEDELGNSTGSSPTEETSEEKKTEAESPGTTST